MIKYALIAIIALQLLVFSISVAYLTIVLYGWWSIRQTGSTIPFYQFIVHRKLKLPVELVCLTELELQRRGRDYSRNTIYEVWRKRKDEMDVSDPSVLADEVERTQAFRR